MRVSYLNIKVLVDNKGLRFAEKGRIFGLFLRKAWRLIKFLTRKCILLSDIQERIMNIEILLENLSKSCFLSKTLLFSFCHLSDFRIYNNKYSILS